MSWLALGILGAGAFALSLLVVYFAREIALRRQMLDHPTDRSSHEVPTPRVGGIGIWLPWSAAFLAYLLLTSDARGAPWPATLLVVSSLVVGLVGLADDLLEGLAPLWKYLGQLLPATLFAALTYSWLFQPVLGANPWRPISAIVLLVAIVWMTALSNFSNFMDGIDGLVGGVAVVSFSAAAITLHEQQQVISASAVVLAAASLGFLAFNRAPAVVFMGDSGSLFLGFHWGVLGIAFFAGASDGLEWQRLVAPLTLAAPIWVDAVATLFVRFIRRRPLTKPHRDHLYQRMVRAGHGHATVSVLYWLYAVLCGTVAFVVLTAPYAGLVASAIVVGGGALAVVFLHKTGHAVAP